MLVIVRPEPGAGATLARAHALGLEAIAAPLFEVVPVVWDPPAPDAHDALLLTSANAVRHAGAGLESLRALPVYAVGEATAAAAREKGLAVAGVGQGDVQAFLPLVAGAGRTHPLHLVGADHKVASHPRLTVTTRIVYAAEAVQRLPAEAIEVLGQDATLLIHSPRAGALIATLTERAGIDRRRVAIAAISESAALAAGQGWRAVAIAARPTDDALLAAAARLCKEEAGRSGERARE